jgi:hypothetical protein
MALAIIEDYGLFVCTHISHHGCEEYKRCILKQKLELCTYKIVLFGDFKSFLQMKKIRIPEIETCA